MIGSRVEMIARFERMAPSLEARVERGVSYGYVRKREPDHYPSVEEFFVVAPVVVGSKARYGFEWFEARRREALGESAQERLFGYYVKMASQFIVHTLCRSYSSRRLPATQFIFCFRQISALV